MVSFRIKQNSLKATTVFENIAVEISNAWMIQDKRSLNFYFFEGKSKMVNNLNADKYSESNYYIGHLKVH